MLPIQICGLEVRIPNSDKSAHLRGSVSQIEHYVGVDTMESVPINASYKLYL